jgi:uncharacterized protein
VEALVAQPDSPSPILAALYRHAFDEARALATAAASLGLFEAAALGRLEALQALAALGEDLRRVSPDGFTTLHLAAYFGHPEVVRWLLVQGLSANAEAPGGLRPLHSAAACPEATASLACARLLLEAGAAPDAAQRGGSTALHAAAQHGHRELAQALLDAGATAAPRTEAGATPEDVARERRQHAWLAWFLRAS